jgi:nucleoside-triphosphatase
LPTSKPPTGTCAGRSSMPELVVVSGWRGCGKTTFCEKCAGIAQAAGWRVAGLLSPAVFHDGNKTGIDVIDLGSGERRRLARLPGNEDGNAPFRTTGWVFDPDQMRWGNEILAGIEGCDLLVVDELGPLELLNDQGWTAGLAALDGGHYRAALAVVRPELLDTARRRWHPRLLWIKEPRQAENKAVRLMRRFLDNPTRLDL